MVNLTDNPIHTYINPSYIIVQCRKGTTYLCNKELYLVPDSYPCLKAEAFGKLNIYWDGLIHHSLSGFENYRIVKTAASFYYSRKLSTVKEKCKKFSFNQLHNFINHLHVQRTLSYSVGGSLGVDHVMVVKVNGIFTDREVKPLTGGKYLYEVLTVTKELVVENALSKKLGHVQGIIDRVNEIHEKMYSHLTIHASLHADQQRIIYDEIDKEAALVFAMMIFDCDGLLACKGLCMT